MKSFRNIHFELLDDFDSGRTFENMEFESCHFKICRFSLTNQPEHRSTGRNLRFRKCHTHGESAVVGPGIIEDVLVDGLNTHGLLMTHGAVFRHVTLRGRIGRIWLKPWARDDLDCAAFVAANARYYETVDWALDISEAEFIEASLPGVPGHLIRRDPATQVLVTPEKVRTGEWRKIPVTRENGMMLWELFLERIEASGTHPEVLVAWKRAKDFQAQLRGLQLLRDCGVAEPD